MNVILCGPPASGKSTLAVALHERLAEAGVETRLLCSDDFDRNAYDRMYETVAGGGDADEDGDGTAADPDGAGDATPEPEHWVLDGTFYSAEHRQRFRALPGTYVVWVRAEKETCIERNRARVDSIPDVAVYTMYAKFEEPAADLVLDTDDLPRATAERTLVRTVLDWFETD